MALKGDTSDLEVLMFGGEPLIPLVNGFSRARRSGIRQSNVEGGASRQRKKFYNTVYDAQATFWLGSKPEQDFIKSFFTFNEGKKFICNLSADRPIVEPYVIQVVSEWEDSYVSEKDGELTVNIEIFSAKEQCLDEFLLPMYQCIGCDLYNVLKEIENLVKAIPEED